MLTLHPRRTLISGAGVGILAVIAFALPADAAGVKGVCPLDAEMKIRDKDDPRYGMRLTEGEAKFTLESPLSCAADGNKDAVPEVASGAHMRAEGWYDNVVCGTGKAFGTVTQISGGSTKLQVLVGKRFAIQFIATHGVFKWRDWDKPDVATLKLPSDPGAKDPAPPGSYTPAGVVAIAPLTAAKPTPTPDQALEDVADGNCGKAFRVTGLVAIDFNS